MMMMIGLSVVTVLLAVSVLLAALLIAGCRLTARGPRLTLRRLSSTGVFGYVEEEEQGLLTDVTASSAAAADTDVTTGDGGRSQAGGRADQSASSDNFTGLSVTPALMPNSITLASSELAPNMFGASSELVRSWFEAEIWPII